MFKNFALFLLQIFTCIVTAGGSTHPTREMGFSTDSPAAWGEAGASPNASLRAAKADVNQTFLCLLCTKELAGV